MLLAFCIAAFAHAALSLNAVTVAGIYLMFEPTMEKKKAVALYASYPKERQTNIELLRQN